MEDQLPNRTLPNGRQYCAELAETEGAQDLCMGDLERLNLQRVRDRERAIERLRYGINRIKASRVRCGWFAYVCKAERRRLMETEPPE